MPMEIFLDLMAVLFWDQTENLSMLGKMGRKDLPLALMVQCMVQETPLDPMALFMDLTVNHWITATSLDLMVNHSQIRMETL